MTTAVDQENTALTIKDGQLTWNKEQKQALIDVLRVRHATEADLAVFFHQARRTGLDPFARQLYMIAREEYDKEARAKVWRQTFQTGIDGFRVVAARRARQLGVPLSYEDTVYIDDEGQEFKVWADPAKQPLAIRVTVRLGESRFPATAYFREYVPLVDEYEGSGDSRHKTGKKVPTAMWAQRPVGQLEKCAEALALRRACPQDLSGIYEFSEMERDRSDAPITTLADDGSKPGPKTGENRTRGQLLWHIRRAPDRTALRALWQEAKDAGWFPDNELEGAIGQRATKLQADAPSTGQESPGEPGDPAESGESDAQSSVQPEGGELFPQDREHAKECIHGVMVWRGHECGDCEDAGRYEFLPDPDELAGDAHE